MKLGFFRGQALELTGFVLSLYAGDHVGDPSRAALDADLLAGDSLIARAGGNGFAALLPNLHNLEKVGIAAFQELCRPNTDLILRGCLVVATVTHS